MSATLIALLVALAAGPDVLIEGRIGAGGTVVFEARGLPADLLKDRGPAALARVLPVFALSEGQIPAADHPPLLGSYDVSGGALRFRSRFPAEPGISYQAGHGPALARVSLSGGPAKPATTEVVRVSPSSDVLPENLLKFYVEFSAPMGRGRAYEQVALLDGRGKRIDLPFLELGEELWDPTATRFTLLFDPGRIKSGLKPREEVGPVLEAGKSYTLVIDTGWLDAQGKPLARPFRKSFKVSAADATPPDPASWTLELPLATTRSFLRARFPEPLDRGLLARMIGVVDASGKPVEGRLAVGDGETSVAFEPGRPWPAGDYQLVIGRDLEDLAGNSVGRPFEVDVFKVIKPMTSETVARPFRVDP